MRQILKRNLIVVLFLFLLFCIVSCSEETTSMTTTTTTTESTTLSPELIGTLNQVFDDAGDIYCIYGITVSYNGELVGERYYNLKTATSKNNVFSVTKSINSLLTGIAIDEGFIDSVEQSIGDYIDLSSYENSEELAEIKIRHLLTMTQGLFWNTDDLSQEMIDLRATNDPIGMILEREISYAPGTQFNYSDGAAHLMSLIISEATGMTIYDFAKEYLFLPLGITDTKWDKDKLGNNIGGCDLYLRNQDMAKIGQLILDMGMHDGEQIVSEEWITTSTNMHHDSFYGYYWWLTYSLTHQVICARGWGGQMIYIVPDLNLVITTTANGYVDGEAASTQFTEIENVVLYDILPLFDESL